VMHQGRLQQYAEPREVYERPANMFVAGFMGSPAMNFLPAEIVAADGRAGIALGNGGGATVLKLPAERAASVGPAGRRIVFGVRPEHLTRHDPTRTRREIGLIEAPVEVVEPTGSETIVIVRVGDREVHASFEPDEAPAVGDRVTLAVDMAKACLFDPESERLI
jgi:multiple sugar transport system ATP-binding protein